MRSEPKTLEEFVNPELLEKTNKRNSPPKGSWAEFIEGDAANFFNLHGLEKLAIEDGNGNKAKLARQKDDSIKIESSSITIL
jgi:hypothetical protein